MMNRSAMGLGRSSLFAGVACVVLSAAACGGGGGTGTGGDHTGTGGDHTGTTGSTTGSAAGGGGSGTGGSSVIGSTTQTVGTKGGSITLDGATITIPAGALPADTEITITATTEHPAGYTLYSPVYQFSPDGLTFPADKPALLEIPFQAPAGQDPKLATFFWSKTGTTGYDWLGGNPTSATVTGSVAHFSKGFIANGVDYSDPPDKSCVVTDLVEGRTAPTGVSVFYTVDDCWGRPVTGLMPSDFALTEDGQAISIAESQQTILAKQGLQVFATLAIDMSASTVPVLAQVISGAKAFVDKLRVQNNLPVQIGIELFAGEQPLTTWQAPTLDATALKTKLDALVGYTPLKPNGTNLNGAVISGLTKLATAETAFRQRNYGGAFTTGYLVLFTDGKDTAAWNTQQQALTAIQQSKDQVVVVALQTTDYDPAAIAALAPNAALAASNPVTLDTAFGAMANRMAGQITRTYLLGYCSPKANGQHTVSVQVAGTVNQTTADYPFDAGQLTGVCSPMAFDHSCDGLQCGGLGCGACDDQTAACASGSNQCASFCLTQNKCSGEVITNGQGYSQLCPSGPASLLCGGTCADTTLDPKNCGACGAGFVGGTCVNGVPGCPGQMGMACNGVCKDLAIDAANCGACGASVIGGTCVNGAPNCAGQTPQLCINMCTDLTWVQTPVCIGVGG